MDRTQEELERRIFYLSALNDLGKEIGPLQELEPICAASLSVTMGAFGAMRGLLVLGDIPAETLKVYVQRGTGEANAPGVAVEDLEQLSGSRVRPALEVQDRLGEVLRDLRMVVWVPLKVEGRLAGGIGLGPKLSGEGFTEDDRSLLSTIGGSVLMALRNATLVEDLQGANAQLERENQSLKVQLEPDPEIVSRSERMSQVLDLAWRVAETPSTVLLRGESGTGKEVIAKAIHRESGFGDGPFVAVHCAALPSGLLESELFGHEKGAFTDATSQRIGRFELAEGGTIFLDEVGEIGPEVQVKLLRVLQERQFERVGGSETLEVNVRVIAATNRDLEAGVREGTFREDLYYRLNVVPVVLPPLRERKEDVPSLVERFLEQYSGEMGRNVTAVSGEAMELLMAYSWPGNVRELQNLVERMVVVADGPVILPQHLPPELRGGQGAKSVVRSGAFLSLAEIERQHVEAALERCEWNQSEAARALEITRAQLRHRIKQYGIEGDWKVGAPVRKGTGD